MANLRVRVIPSSSKNAIVDSLDDTLKLKVQALPKKGKANKAVIELLSSKLGIVKDSIQVASGHTSQLKVISIDGLIDGHLTAAIAALND